MKRLIQEPLLECISSGVKKLIENILSLIDLQSAFTHAHQMLQKVDKFNSKFEKLPLFDKKKSNLYNI